MSWRWFFGEKETVSKPLFENLTEWLSSLMRLTHKWHYFELLVLWLLIARDVWNQFSNAPCFASFTKKQQIKYDKMIFINSSNMFLSKKQFKDGPATTVASNQTHIWDLISVQRSLWMSAKMLFWLNLDISPNILVCLCNTSDQIIISFCYSRMTKSTYFHNGVAFLIN